ncbi:MAG TPA: carboxymuconolactone decarboxylase family protein, partial [Micromonosporaceae bacterium]
MSRIPPLEPPYEPDVDEQLTAMMPAGVPPIALFRTFATNLPMVRAMRPWGAYTLGRDFSLSLRDREIVIIRTGALTGCEYEWGVHVLTFAAKARLTEEQVESLTYGAATDACWDAERDRLLIRAVDALYADGDIDDALWAELAEVFDGRQLLDLPLLTGWYHAISFV